MRVPRSGIGGFGTARVPFDLHRHRRRAVDRRRPVYLFVAPAQHEEHARGGFVVDAGADRRVRVGYRAGHRRRHRRGHPRTPADQRVLRRHHDPLCQYQILCVEYRGHRQWRHDVRRAEYPPAVPPRNGQAGQFVRRGDRPQDRAPGGYYPRGGREGRQRPYQHREAAA